MGWKEDVIGQLWEARAEQLRREDEAAADYTGLKDHTEPPFPLEGQLAWWLPGQLTAQEALEGGHALHCGEAERYAEEFQGICREVTGEADFYVQFANCDLEVSWPEPGCRSIRATRRPLLPAAK